MDMDKNGLQNIKKMYEKLNYFDQYGGSVVLFIIITIMLILFISYSIIIINAQPIIDDWVNQRCKPNIIPFAGYITHPDGMTASEYTYQNFTYCTQNILSNISGIALEPITFVTNTLKQTANTLQYDIQNIRAMFNKIRDMFQNISKEIMGRIMNVVIPLQQIIINFKDLIGKIQGTMTASLFTLLGSYYALKSLMGAIAQFIIGILITLATMIAVFWAVPFTWGAAIANTSIFVAIAIPMSIILAFMINTLHVKTSLHLPHLKCFDKNTLITMNDGSIKPICNINNGDILIGNNVVTACIKVTSIGSTMYNLNGIIVSNSHIVNYNNKWILVSEHPDAQICINYNEPYLYCLNTTNKNIIVNNIIFTDWDEIYDNDIIEIQNKTNLNSNEYHKYLDGGFIENTLIQLKDGSYIKIKDIKINDVLKNGEQIYGIVKINGSDLYKQFKYHLGNKIFKGGPNLVIYDNYTTINLDNSVKKSLPYKHKTLIHLLTNTKTINIDNIIFCDYNASIDIFLEKKKLLSMNYV